MMSDRISCLAHAVGTRLEGDVLKAALAGKTLSVAQSFAGGPYAWQLHADGKFSNLAGAERRELSSRKWGSTIATAIAGR